MPGVIPSPERLRRDEPSERSDEMKILATLLCLCVLPLPALASETLITKRKTVDAITVPGQEKPEQVQTELTWLGKDRLRVDLGSWTTLVRRDQYKLYQINHETRTYSVVDLPVHLDQYVPEKQKKFLEKAISEVTVTVTPTTETRKFHDWTATKYVLSMTVPKRGTFTEEIWAANEVGFDASACFALWSARMQLQPIGALMAAQEKSIVGFPVFVERAQMQEGNTFRGRDEVLSIEKKDAPEGTFDLPKDYTEKPFDLADGAMKLRPAVETEISTIPFGEKKDGEPVPPVPPPQPAPK